MRLKSKECILENQTDSVNAGTRCCILLHVESKYDFFGGGTK